MDKMYYLWEYFDKKTQGFFSREEVKKIEEAYALNRVVMKLGADCEIDFNKKEMKKGKYKYTIKRIALDGSIYAIANKKEMWQYMDEKVGFVDYAPDIARIIEAGYKTQETKRGIFINERMYIIDYKNLEQINSLTLYKRQIRRNKENKSGGSKPNAIWVWLDDSRIFKPYNSLEVKTLEMNYQNKKRNFNLSYDKSGYDIDLKEMVQINPISNKSRDIRRIPSDLLLDPIIWEYETPQGFVPYNEEDNNNIEKAYKSNNPKYSGTGFTIDFGGMSYKNSKGINGRVRKKGQAASLFLWQYLSDDGYVSYEAYINNGIEADYQNGKPSFSFTDSGNNYVLHFSSMEQENKKEYYFRAIRRIDENAKKWKYYQSRIIPQHNTLKPLATKAPMVVQAQNDEFSYAAELDQRSTEYEFVLSKFDQTMKGKYKNIKVRKVNNAVGKSLYKKEFDLYKSMEGRDPLVLYLFYGNSKANLSKICVSQNESFDSQYSKSTDVLGKDIHFSTSAASIHKAFRYGEKDKYYIIFAKVMVGEPGDYNTMRKPLLNSSVTMKKNADSTTYFVTKGNMAYPKYLIEYTE